MIKFILNGSFRSGTTMLYKIMKESNPNILVFCEPLHNNLFKSIYKENVSGELPHGYLTTGEYISTGDVFLDQIRRSHPLIGDKVYTYDSRSVIEYFKLFDGIVKDVVLQPNRLHFVLGEVAKRFQCPVTHVIRHPLDVFYSTCFSSPKIKLWKERIKYGSYYLRIIKDKSPYFLNEQYNFVSMYYGVELEKSLINMQYIKPKTYLLSKFVIAWTLSNWQAVQNVKSADGLVVRYEDCVSGEALALIEQYSGVRMNASTINLYSKSIREHDSSSLDLCTAIAKKYGILDKYLYLIKKYDYNY